MSERRSYLDVIPGETRGVVTLDGRPERLLIERAGDPPAQALGAHVAARVRAIQRAAAIAFLDMGEGPDAILNLNAETGPLAEGQWLQVEVRSESRQGKGASARLVGPWEGPPGVITPAPSLADRLKAFAPTSSVQTGAIARTVADTACEEALASEFALPGGGSIAVERTRALTAVDVDLGGQTGETKRATRSANMAALNLAARVLRLKGLGGLVVIDLVGRGHDAPALLSAARAAFGPDNPGVALGQISRFGVIELTVPRRARSPLERLLDVTGALSLESEAFDLVRALEREALAEPGGRFTAVAGPGVAEAAAPWVMDLTRRFGARLAVKADAARARGQAHVVRD